MDLDMDTDTADTTAAATEEYVCRMRLIFHLLGVLSLIEQNPKFIGMCIAHV